MSRTILLTVLGLVIIASSSALSQVDSGLCGDIDNTGDLSIGDLTAQMSYLFSGNSIAPFENRADCDGKRGITIADHCRLGVYLFLQESFLDCSADGEYSNTLSLSDTVYLPMACCIPPESTKFELTWKLRIHDERHTSFYLPLDPLADGSNGTFVFDSVAIFGPLEYREGQVELQNLWPNYRDSIDLKLYYTRVGEGFGCIRTDMRDINSRLRYVIVSDVLTDAIDLHRPVVVREWQNDYPVGDLDCDCRQSLADLTRMISGLFITLEWPLPCRCGD